MLGTSVWAVDSGEGVNGRIAAFTGLFPKSRKLGFIDCMTITKWEPPRVCDVLHTGKVARRRSGSVRCIGTSNLADRIDVPAGRNHFESSEMCFIRRRVK